ncbi:uncharacterized protein [Drosophila pseudoobscura]|uniref:Uncharacterized protein isoform X2 n=1 Tax=Drosophila pseudoobscura pseudoobscura TaxID=46245 RepID=A0A6I8VTR0_DROPS|nr:uncharacterized protein LOC26532480 isoform X2 [Drosophila pseudoobscura]
MFVPREYKDFYSGSFNCETTVRQTFRESLCQQPKAIEGVEASKQHFRDKGRRRFQYANLRWFHIHFVGVASYKDCSYFLLWNSCLSRF